MTSVVSRDPVVKSDRSASIKARQQAMWASGDFAVIGTTIQIVGELLVKGSGRLSEMDHSTGAEGRPSAYMRAEETDDEIRKDRVLRR